MIKFLAWISDGRIVVLIRDIRYTYYAQAYHHYRWKRMSRYRPWKALNEIKKVAECTRSS